MYPDKPNSYKSGNNMIHVKNEKKPVIYPDNIQTHC